VSLLDRLFVLIFLVLVPLAALRTARLIRDGAGFPSRAAYYAQAIVLQACFAGFGAYVASQSHPVLLREWRTSREGAMAGIVLLAVLAATLRPRWRRASPEARSALYQLVPHRRAELLPYVLLALVASVSEELVYRGVLVNVLADPLGGYWPASIVSAVAFAAAHTLQGRQSVFIIGALALALHLVVHLAGTLSVAIGVHFAYDVLAGIFYARAGRC
jgi:membrane protease YdiL (CAAX protease family)